MFEDETTESLKARLDDYDATIKELRSYGSAAMLDCRKMRICESNSSFIRTELYRRMKLRNGA